MAPELSVALHPILSMNQGLVSGLKSYFQVGGTMSAVTTGFWYLL